MKIGIDLSSIQGPHRMRGIGQTTINLVNHMPAEAKKNNEFVFYVYEDNYEQVLNELDLSNVDYQLRFLLPEKKIAKRPPGRLGVVVTGLNQLLHLLSYYRGDSRIEDVSGLDIFFQCDQSIPLPKRRSQKNIAFAHDIIPYVLANDYLWSYAITRHYGYSRKYALRQATKRWFYIKKLRVNNRRAQLIISNSEQTRKDFIEHVQVKPSKIIVAHLGANSVSTALGRQSFTRYHNNSWGYSRTTYRFTKDEKYILFIGGVDKRRKLEDLVTAFNHLRAEDHDIKLVLAGDCMRGADEIDNDVVKKALKTSSYQDEIIYLGFVTQIQRDWLYTNALAFIFPSVYEGFGLPVIEAMSYGTPVICYENNAVKEVALDVPVYAKDWMDIYNGVLGLLNSEKTSSIVKNKSRQLAAKYTWNKSSKILFGLFEKF